MEPTDDFECHITLRGDAKKLRKKIEELNWSFSSIHGDPVFGDLVLCYATNHYKSEHMAAYEIGAAVRALLNMGVTPIRAKVEKIVLDIRF